jgi:hypothetical protein
VPITVSAHTELTADHPNWFIIAPNFIPVSFETGSVGNSDEHRAPIMKAGDNFLSAGRGSDGQERSIRLRL